MNKEIKERYIKKVLENHIMWSGSNDRKPSEISDCVFADYMHERVLDSFDSLEDYYGMKPKTQESFVSEYREEFTVINELADYRWQKALEVMGL